MPKTIPTGGVVFKYDYNVFGGFYMLIKAYPLVRQTRDEVLVKHWYGKRWHPKNMNWRLERPMQEKRQS